MSYSTTERDSQGNIWKISIQSGNYRVYKNGLEVFKADGKKNSHKEDAIDFMRARMTSLKPARPAPTVEEATQADRLNEANNSEIDLTEGMASNEDEYRDIINYILAEHRRTNTPPIEILEKITEDPSLLPEEIRSKFSKEGNYVLKDQLINRLHNVIGGDTVLTSLEDRLREKQESRKSIYDELADLPEKKQELDQATLEMMVAPETGIQNYQDIWEKASDETQENLTPQKLHSLDTMQGLGKLKTQGQEQSDLYSKLMPDKDFSINWGNNPTYENARDTYNQDFKPNYNYSSSSPFDQRGHQLAASGHALGSTSLENNESGKQRAMHKEDLENIFNVQRMLETEHRARGDTLKQIEGLGNAGRSSLGEPIKTSEDVLGRQFDRDFDQGQKQNEFKTNIAEGGMSLNTTEMGEEASLYNLLKSQNQETQAEGQQLNHTIYNYLMNAEQLRKGGVEEQKQLEAMDQQMWANKQQVINSIKALALQERSLDMQETAKELERSQNNKNAWLKILGTLGGAALAAAVPGGSALMGLATVAPAIAQSANFGSQGIPNQGWFNSKGRQ